MGSRQQWQGVCRWQNLEINCEMEDFHHGCETCTASYISTLAIKDLRCIGVGGKEHALGRISSLCSADLARSCTACVLCVVSYEYLMCFTT